LLNLQAVFPNAVNVAVDEGAEGFELCHRHLKADIGTGIARSKVRPAQGDNLTILFCTEDLYPGDVVFHRIGMRSLLANNYVDNISAAFSFTLANLDKGDMLLLSLCFSTL
jgi:hypothetical protein